MFMPRISQLGRSGATDGQVVTWDNTLMEWVAADPAGGGGALDDLSDVDTTTTPPGDGDRLGFDLALGLWVPVAPVDGLPVGGTTGQVLTKQSSTDGDADWETPSGGGGGLNWAIRKNRTSGDLVVASASAYGTLDSGLDITGSAAVGDLIVFGASFNVVDGSASEMIFDVCSVVGGSAVNYLSGSTSTGFGIQSWSVNATDKGGKRGASLNYRLVAGDISSGQVTLRILRRVLGSSVNRTVSASSSSPLTFWANNHGSAPTS